MSTDKTSIPGEGSRLQRGPMTKLLDLFSSIWFGVFLLACLFVYSAIGSAGLPIHPNILDPAAWISVRQHRWFELSEFEWFHFWPFKMLIALICIVLVTATLRRIPFKLVNLGVWTIHTGIIVLALGSVWYFSTKVEGDALIVRRQLRIEVPGAEPISIAALPGNHATVETSDDTYQFRITIIDPNWEILTGDDAGTRAYSVSVAVQTQDQQFIRQLLVDYPQYTEDVIRTDDPAQPMQRAVKALGRPLVNEDVTLTLDYKPQNHFYLMDSRAVYVREKGAAQWIQRPVHGLPRYNDYIAQSHDVWHVGSEIVHPDPIRIDVHPTEANDPLQNVSIQISRYLRYAHLETRRRADPNGALDPLIEARLTLPSGESERYQLAAFEPVMNTALEGNLMFSWVESQSAIDKVKTRQEPILQITLPNSNSTVELPIQDTLSINPELPYIQIEGSQYSYRVENLQDHLEIDGEDVSVAIVQFKSGERTFRRWVFDNPSRNRDMAMTEELASHESVIPLDKNIETVYVPGTRPPAPLMIIAGPEENDLGVLITKITGQPRFEKIAEGDEIDVVGGVKLIIDRYVARTTTEIRPFVVPRDQRDRDMRELLSMIHVEFTESGTSHTAWLPFHMFAFESEDEVLRRFPYNPFEVTLGDGRTIEMLFSRARMPLPDPVVLEDFQIDTHIGGFTGRTTSILDWTSVVRFQNDNDWTKSMNVSVNDPVEHKGYWFFQAQWDPPDPPRFPGDTGSSGLNYTVLGVGNRNGVKMQLAGCCIAVIGMIYAFYVKPIIKRRRRERVHASLRETERELVEVTQ